MTTGHFFTWSTLTEAQIGNWETYALRKSRKVALQYFETEWVGGNNPPGRVLTLWENRLEKFMQILCRLCNVENTIFLFERMDCLKT